MLFRYFVFISASIGPLGSLSGCFFVNNLFAGVWA
jgi:hypothetical protein